MARFLTAVTDKGAVTFPGGGGVEDLWRLLKGFDVRGGSGLRNQTWTPAILDTIEGFADPANRFLSFNGTRRTVSNDSASVTFIDVTGVSNGDIDRLYGQAGAPIGGGGDRTTPGFDKIFNIRTSQRGGSTTRSCDMRRC